MCVMLWSVLQSNLKLRALVQNTTWSKTSVWLCILPERGFCKKKKNHSMTNRARSVPFRIRILISTLNTSLHGNGKWWGGDSQPVPLVGEEQLEGEGGRGGFRWWNAVASRPWGATWALLVWQPVTLHEGGEHSQSQVKRCSRGRAVKFCPSHSDHLVTGMSRLQIKYCSAAVKQSSLFHPCLIVHLIRLPE